MSANFNTQTGNGEYQLQFETDNKHHFLLMQEFARRFVDGKPVVLELEDTVGAMCSEDYKARFMAEYYQTKIRYEKLKKFNTKIEAARSVHYSTKRVEMPKHDCPDELLREQQSVMGNYLHLLELRAEIEGIEL
jgi:hypothetical protein